MLNLEILNSKYNLKVYNIAHVGAHNGKEVLVYNRLFPNADVHLFEPNKSSYEELENKFKDKNKIYLYNLALGNESGEKLLNTSSSFPNTSSILEPNLHKEYYPEVVFDNEEIIQLKKFDSLGLKNVNFMSIDTQGYELEVLKGSKEQLSNMDYLIVEINRIHLYDKSPLVKDIDKFLKSYSFIRIVTTYWGKECVWGDGFYIKRDKISHKQFIRAVIKNFLYKNIYIYKLVRFFKTQRKI